MSSNPTVACQPLDIKPNYSSPVGDVYVHVARQIIIEINTLDVLGGCGGSKLTSASGRAPDLPSWVSDWSTAQTVSPMLFDALGKQRATHATSHSKALPQFIDTGSTTLLLHAHEVATLIAFAQPLMHPIVHGEEIMDSSGKKMDKLYLTLENDSLRDRLKHIGGILVIAWKGVAELIKKIMGIVPLLATFSDWEAFATAAPSTNPCQSESRPDPSSSNPIDPLDIPTQDDEPEDKLGTYWQTLCTGTYDDTAAAASEKSRKIATQELFYKWRASLKPIHDLHRWKPEGMLQSAGLLGYIVKSYHEFGDFARFLESSYGRRLGRAANGYLCLVPEATEVGDRVILARGGRVPLVVRDGGNGYRRLVGEAYVHGIMDGQAWEEGMCKEFKIR